MSERETQQIDRRVMDEAELEAERRRGRLAGAAAITAGMLFAAGMIWSQIVNRGKPDRADDPQEFLPFHDDHASSLLASSALQSLAMLLLGIVAFYLYRAVKARKPSEPSIVAFSAIYGPVVLGVATLAGAIVLANIASDFVARPRAARTEDAAKDLLDGAGFQIVQGVGFSGALALVFWFIKNCLDAMRIGLLSRFMGVVGVILGPALLFGVGQLLLPFWLVALGFMYLGVSPRGRPPAWEAGTVVESPGLGSSRARPDESEPGEAGGERNGEVQAVGPGVRPAADDDHAARAEAGPRRKRKRRE
jgi:hypothetical protein